MSENQLPESSPIPQSNDPSLPVPMPSATADRTPMYTPSPAPGVRGGRPAGVTLLAIVSFVSGFVGLCCPALPLMGLSALGIALPTGITQVLGLLGLLLSFILAVGPLLQMVFAYGAWNLRPWAWWLGVLAMGFSVLGVLVNTLGSGGTLAWTAITNGIVPIIILVYLLLPDTRKSFKV